MVKSVEIRHSMQPNSTTSAGIDSSNPYAKYMSPSIGTGTSAYTNNKMKNIAGN